MKKLEKLTLKELGDSVLVIEGEEAIGIRGREGDLAYLIRYGSYLPDGTSYDPMRDVCYPTDTNPEATSYVPNQTTISQGPCPQCEAFHNANEYNSLGGVDGENVMTPIGEFFANTLPHMMGWGNHVDGSQ